MKVLLLTQIVPYPPDSGPKVKTYYLLRSLAQHHRITLVAFTRNEQEERDAAALRDLCEEVHTVHLQRSRMRDMSALATSAFSQRSWLMERDNQPEMHAFLAKLVQKAQQSGQPFDLVHADQLNMAMFADRLPLPRLLDQHNAVWTIFKRMAQQEAGPKRLFLEREWRLLKRFEGDVCARFEAVTSVSEEDRQALFEAIGATRDMPVIPIAVDADREQPIPRMPNAQAVLSMATMMWPPNVDGVMWFAHEMYPLIRRAIPATRFFVVGQRPVAEVRALPEADASIEVTGYVADPKSYIAQSACLIVPLRSGGGMRVKILEALARGIPIVSTTIGYEGIDLEPGKHLLVADTPRDFAEAVLRLIREPDFGQELARQGRERLLERYDWRAVYPAMEAAYRHAVGRAEA